MPGYSAQDLFNSDAWEDWADLDDDAADGEPELDPPASPDEEPA